MKKISKIILENFRVFSGKNEINFNNSNGEPADFVCVYGKNGSGKTSLFDGFEWFFTGEIHLLKKDLKNNVSKYTGDILKYKYAGVKDKAGVEIEYSDGQKGCRTVIKRKNSINDYGKGRANGIYKEMLNEKQILPHSKIDNFVYATKPADMYEEWGNFWDPDNSQREIFESVCKVYKKFIGEIKEYDKKIEELENDIEQLNIKQKIEFYNSSVDRYNCLKIREIPDLPHIEYLENNKINLENDIFSQAIGKQLNVYISNKDFQKNQCEFLLQHFEEYEEVIRLQKEIADRKKRREKIISKCQQKTNLLLQIGDLEREKKSYIEAKEKLAAEFDKSWFENYKKYINTKTVYQAINDKLENNKIELQQIKNNIDVIQENIKRRKQKINEYQIKCETWKRRIIEFDDMQKKILPAEKILDNLKKVEMQKKIYVQELSYLNKALIGDYEKFFDSLNADEQQLYVWIQECRECEQKVKVILDNARLKEKKKKKKYKEIQQNTENLERLWMLAEEEIRKKELCTCPVCKSKFKNMEELLGTIDISAQKDSLTTFYVEWDKANILLKKAEENYQTCCENIKKSIRDRVYLIKQKIVETEEEIIYYEKEWNKIQKLNEERERLQQEISLNLSTDVEKLSIEFVKTVCKKNINLLEKLLIEDKNNQEDQKKKLKEIEENNRKNEITSKDLKKEIENFNNDTDNLRRRETMEHWRIFSYEEFQKKLEDYSDKVVQCELKESNIEDALKKYKIYYANNIEKYSSFVTNPEIKSIDWLEYYEQCRKNLFRNQDISKKTLIKYLQKSEDGIKVVHDKLTLWNECMSKVIVEDFINKYNQKLDTKMKLEGEIAFSKDKERFAEDIFKTVKGQLEEHIKKVFGGVTISQIYSKIEPHKRFTKLRYKININENGNPELYLKVLNEKNEDIMPELFFSSAQLNTVALSVFLGGALSASEPKVNTIFIDDPVGHFDDLNVLSFIDVLRTIVEETNWQIIISTHEESFYEIMKVKLNPQNYNSKFLVFKEEGKVEEDIDF